MKKRKKSPVRKRDEYLDENLAEYEDDSSEDEEIEKAFEENHNIDFLIDESKEEKRIKISYPFILGSVIFLAIAILIVFNPVLLKIDFEDIFGKKSVPVEENKEEEESSITLKGEMGRMDKGLGLIDDAPWKYMGDDKYDPETDAIYYEAGTFTSGEYKDYKRIILIMPLPGMGGNEVRILATNDEKTYVLDGNPSDVGKYKRDDWESPLYGLREDKIIKVDWLPSEHPEKIDLEGAFALYRKEILVEYSEVKKDRWETTIGKYSGYKKEENDISGLKVYLSSAYPKPSNYDELGKADPVYKDKLDRNIKYTGGYSSVILVDSIGLPYVYNIGNKTVVISNIKSTDLSDPKGLYNEYGYAFPGGCGGRSDTLIAKGITENDLEKVKVLKKSEIELYKLKNQNHPLLKLAYDEKTDFMYTGDYRQPYTITDVKDVRPTYEKYIEKPPLLFFKDPFGRWNMFVEYQYLMPGGCGKPVLYFYPEKPTEITVSFGKEMFLTRDIPSYSGGWKILAGKDGSLRDLQPELTDCATIGSSLKGLEYAFDACRNNSYPYIYWAGDTLDSSFPEQRRGWVVAKNDLEFFINSKLDEIGLTAKEKGDMLEYWIPEMLEKNAPYYKISFIQDKAMNSFIPMNITPIPNSFGRVFLDWLPLREKIEIEPQDLQKIVRSGFTVIEWGGIKR